MLTPLRILAFLVACALALAPLLWMMYRGIAGALVAPPPPDIGGGGIGSMSVGIYAGIIEPLLVAGLPLALHRVARDVARTAGIDATRPWRTHAVLTGVGALAIVVLTVLGPALAMQTLMGADAPAEFGQALDALWWWQRTLAVLTAMFCGAQACCILTTMGLGVRAIAAQRRS